MRVAFVSHSSALRGAERALLELLIGLRSRGVSCFVILRQHGDLVDKLAEVGIPTAIFPYGWWIAGGPWWKRPLREVLTLVFLFPVIWQIKRWQAEVIFTNTVGTPVGAFAAGILRKPHVWYLHEFGWEDHGLTFDFGIAFSSYLIGRLSRSVPTNSEAVRHYYARYIPRHLLKCVYQAVELPPQSSEVKLTKGAGTVTLLLIGALHEAKGHMEAIAALAHLARQNVFPTLNIVGTGREDYVQRLKKAVADAGLEKSIHFTGEVSEPSAAIAASQIVLMCSRAEAFGRVTIEAMKLGKPVIGARSGATPELIRENFNGLLYAAGDPVELADRIRQLSQDCELCERLGSNGRAWALDKFNTESYSGQILELLMELNPEGGKTASGETGPHN